MFTALATNMWLTSTFDRLFGGGVGSKGSWILGAVPAATGPMWRMRNICITVSYAVQAMANTCFYCIYVCVCVWGGNGSRNKELQEERQEKRHQLWLTNAATLCALNSNVQHQ